MKTHTVPSGSRVPWNMRGARVKPRCPSAGDRNPACLDVNLQNSEPLPGMRLRPVVGIGYFPTLIFGRSQGFSLAGGFVLMG